MFRIDANPTFWRTVTADIPSADIVDGVDKVSFTVQFRALHRDEAKALDDAWAALSDDDKFEQRFHILKATVVGWGTVEGGNADLGTFSAEALDKALGWPWIGPAMIAAWRSGQAGEDARLGN